MRSSILVFVGCGICWLALTAGSADGKDKHKHHSSDSAEKTDDDGFEPALPPHDLWTVKTARTVNYKITHEKLTNGSVDEYGRFHNDGAHTEKSTENASSTKFGFQQITAKFMSYEGDDVTLKWKYEEKKGKKTVKKEQVVTYRPSALGPEDQKWLSRMKKLKNKTTWTLASGESKSGEKVLGEAKKSPPEKAAELNGEMTGYNEEEIRLKSRSGKVTDVAISSLSTEDQTFVAAMKKAN